MPPACAALRRGKRNLGRDDAVLSGLAQRRRAHQVFRITHHASRITSAMIPREILNEIRQAELRTKPGVAKTLSPPPNAKRTLAP